MIIRNCHDDRATLPMSDAADTYRVHTSTMRRLSVLALGTALLGCACSSHTSKPQVGPTSTLTVHAQASVIHGGRTYNQNFGGQQAIAIRSDGERFTATFDAQGLATIRLGRGRYEVNTSLTDACAPAHVTIPAPTADVRLSCTLP